MSAVVIAVAAAIEGRAGKAAAPPAVPASQAAAATAVEGDGGGGVGTGAGAEKRQLLRPQPGRVFTGTGGCGRVWGRGTPWVLQRWPWGGLGRLWRYLWGAYGAVIGALKWRVWSGYGAGTGLLRRYLWVSHRNWKTLETGWKDYIFIAYLNAWP